MKFCVLAVGEAYLAGTWYRGELHGLVPPDARRALDVLVEKVLSETCGVRDPVLVAPHVISSIPPQDFENLTNYLPLLVRAATAFDPGLIVLVAERHSESGRENILATDPIVQAHPGLIACGVARETIEAWFLDYAAINRALGLRLSGAPPDVEGLPPSGEGSAKQRLLDELTSAGYDPGGFEDPLTKIANAVSLDALRSRCKFFISLEANIKRVLSP